jgi:hypothetical protein
LYAKEVHANAAVFATKLEVGVAVHDNAKIGLIQKKTFENRDHSLVVVVDFVEVVFVDVVEVVFVDVVLVPKLKLHENLFSST